MPTLAPENGNKSKNNGYSQCAYNVISTAASFATPALISYFAAPYLALATRAVFPTAYAMAVGKPSLLAYYTQYVPAREYTCNLVYNKAHIILGGTIGAAITSTRLISGAFSSVSHSTAKAASSVAGCMGFFSFSKKTMSKPKQTQEEIELDEYKDGFVLTN